MTDPIRGEEQEWSQDSDNQLLSTLAHAKINQPESSNGDTTKDVAANMEENTTLNVNDQSNATSGQLQSKKQSKNEEKKIFVGGISWDTTDEHLRNYFSQFGEVSNVQIKYDHYTGRSRGFAFIEFATPEACQKSLDHKDYELNGKKMEVKPAKSRENKKIFVGGLPTEYTEDELRRHFEEFGKIEEIEWPFDKFHNKRKNFAFIVFEEEDATQKAASQNKQKFGDRMCDVKIAVPQYMRPQRQFQMPPAYGTGWSEFAGYGAYGSYAGGYGAPTGGYYDDYSYGAGAGAPGAAGGYDYGAAHNATGAAAAGYDYSGWAANAGTGYESWNYGAGGAGAATAGTASRGRGGYSGYGAY